LQNHPLSIEYISLFPKLNPTPILNKGRDCRRQASLALREPLISQSMALPLHNAKVNLGGKAPIQTKLLVAPCILGFPDG